MLDIKRILTEHGIHWIDQGQNVAKGNINIQCPWCGSEDGSQHLGINPITQKFGCWRSEKHRGSNLARLLAKLDIYISEDRGSAIQKLINRTYFNEQETKPEEVEVFTTKLPDEFVPIEDESFLNKPYLNYLRNRGFNKPLEVCQDYDLRRSYMADKWAARIIIPIRVNDWVTWTGRALGNNPLRYLSPAKKEATNIKKSLFNFNELKEESGDILVVCEGPFDALKVDYYFQPEIRATCIFGLMSTEDQLTLLKQLCYNFNTILIGLDQKTLVQSMNLCKRLTNFNPLIMKMPSKDLGSMTPKEIISLIGDYKN